MQSGVVSWGVGKRQCRAEEGTRREPESSPGDSGRLYQVPREGHTPAESKPGRNTSLGRDLSLRWLQAIRSEDSRTPENPRGSLG